MSALELCEVVKHYGGSPELIRAVDGVSLRVEPGELAAIYGPSGSGKTTLLLLAAGLLRPDAGTVLFGQADLTRLTARASARYRREQVGFVFQSFHLIAGACALDNAALKLLAAGMSLARARSLALPWIEHVGLSRRKAHTPDRLSAGERQRVAIARALVNEPAVLFADEPTGNLDSKRSREILGLLRDTCHERQIPVLLVTHDQHAMAFADRVHTLRDGFIADGLDAELAMSFT
jgi:putative ABC transport system ATP-binding protein